MQERQHSTYKKVETGIEKNFSYHVSSLILGDNLLKSLSSLEDS